MTTTEQALPNIGTAVQFDIGSRTVIGVVVGYARGTEKVTVCTAAGEYTLPVEYTSSVA